MYRILMISYLVVMLCTTPSASSANKNSADRSEPIVPLNHLPALKGDYFKIRSEEVDRSFHIYVRYPEEYHREPDARYPVVYLTDGDSLFPLIAAGHLFFHYDDDLPEAIIVGIAYGSFDPSINKRGFDYTSPANDARDDQGGAARYSRFLKYELIPEIDRKYRTDPERRILFGQSLGGHYVLYSAFTDPDLFWGRIASNPHLEPGRDRFFGTPAKALRSDLGLVYASGSNDRPHLRKDALKWFETWRNVDDAPWKIKQMTIEDGTHAADATNVYRRAMNWLFKRHQTSPDR